MTAGPIMWPERLLMLCFRDHLLCTCSSSIFACMDLLTFQNRYCCAAFHLTLHVAMHGPRRCMLFIPVQWHVAHGVRQFLAGAF